MIKLSENKLLLYQKLSRKRAFIYEIKDKLYAVNGNRIIEVQGRYNKCHYEVYKRLLGFQHQKERICSSIVKLSIVAKSECEYDFMKLASFIKNSDIYVMEQLEQGMEQYDSNYKRYCSLA